MTERLKLFFCWLAVAAGAGLVLAAPFNLKGVGIGAVGAVLLVAGLIPALKARRQARLDRERNK